MAGVGDLVRWTGDGQTQVGYLVVGRLGGRVTLCVFCTVDVEMRSAGFLVEPRNQGRRFGLKTTRTVCLLFGLKITRTVSPSLASKPVASGLLVWASKLVATVW
jgi:hypothetical protein